MHYFLESSIVVMLVVSCLINLILAQNTPCVTPNSEPGNCVLFDSCVAIANEWKSYGNNKPEKLRNYIKESRCKVEKNKICCASTTSSLTATTTTTAIKATQNSYTGTDSNSVLTSKLNKRGFDILNSLTCGTMNGDRVAFGKDAKLNSFPWMVLLRYDTSAYPFQCGGTLITNRYVLTAAHCVSGNSLDVIGVRLGEYDLDLDEDCQIFGRKKNCNPSVEDVGVDQIKSHPQYTRRLLTYDIALIKLDRNVDFKVHIQPICLPITQRSASLAPEKLLLIAGWGTTDKGTTSNVLKFAELNLKERQYCQNVLQRSIVDNQLCAVGKNGQDSCRGDSGGPLFIDAPYKAYVQYIQFGVVSYGHIGCGSENMTYPGVYANVINLLPWITENID